MRHLTNRKFPYMVVRVVRREVGCDKWRHIGGIPDKGVVGIKKTSRRWWNIH
jgi:hypothetical protein